MASEDVLIRLSVVFKKFGLIANEFLSSVSFSMSALSTLALNFISFTLAMLDFFLLQVYANHNTNGCTN